MAYTYDHPRPSVTVDSIVLKYAGNKVEILLIQRSSDPFKGHWALPGGFLDMDETPEDGAKRELKEETGLEAKEILEVGVFGKPDRDPRGRVISLAYLTILKGNTENIKAASDASDAKWFDLHGLPGALAFDHSEIINKAIDFLRKGFKLAMVEKENFLSLSNGEIPAFHTYLTE